MKNFIRTDFFPQKNKLSSSSLELLFSEFIEKKKIYDDFTIVDISSLNNFRENSVLFLDKVITDLYIPSNILVITNKLENLRKKDKNIFLVNNLSQTYNLITDKLFYHEDSLKYQDNFDFIDGSHISKFANIHNTTKIGRNCVINRGVVIGPNCIIKNNVTIKNSILSSDIIVGDNTSIGTSGFGFDYYNRGAKYINPHLGIVYIDKNTRIGSCCAIDRAKIDVTFIGKNCMIDNLIHIAHNVKISDNACIAAQTGISGSVEIGKNITIGGQVGFAGHINIGDNVVIAAKSGVTKNIDNNQKVGGFPAMDLTKWKKSIIKNR